MTCKDCVHEKVCKNAYLFKVTPPNVCGFFKNKADFVKVRCAECKFYENVEYYPEGTKDVCKLFKRQLQPDDFCSYGERK